MEAAPTQEFRSIKISLSSADSCVPVTVTLPLVAQLTTVGEMITLLPPALASTNAVVATCVVFVPTVAVGAVGVPVRAGEASGARELSSVPESCACPAVPVNVSRSPEVELVGPDVSPAPEPAIALLLVTVVAVAAMGTWPAVMPERGDVLPMPGPLNRQFVPS
jgi:hypothetical protein